MKEYRQKRKYLEIRNKVNEKLEFNPFVLSRQFWYWALIGLIGGATAAIYWIALEYVMHLSMLLSGWVLIPLMAAVGLAGRLHYSPLFHRGLPGPDNCYAFPGP